jgi:hypothetical protein
MCLLARGVKYLLHNNNNNYYYCLLIQCIRARINVFVCVCVFPCAKKRSTESTCVLELFAREKRCDNGRLLFRSLDRFSLRLEFALKFFARVFLFRVYFVFVLLSFSLSLSFRERMKKKSSNVTFWIDVAFVNGCE